MIRILALVAGEPGDSERRPTRSRTLANRTGQRIAVCQLERLDRAHEDWFDTRFRSGRQLHQARRHLRIAPASVPSGSHSVAGVAL